MTQILVLLSISSWWLTPKSPGNKGGNTGCCYLKRQPLLLHIVKYSLPFPDSFPSHEDWDNHVGLSITFPVLAMIYNKAFLTPPLHDLFIHYSMYFNHCSDSRGTAAELYNTRWEVFHQDQQTISEGSEEWLPRKSSQSSVALIHCQGVNIFIRHFL